MATQTTKRAPASIELDAYAADRFIDTGMVGVTHPAEQDDMDGGAGSDALGGGDDSAAAIAASTHSPVACPEEAATAPVRPFTFRPYEAATKCTGGPAPGAGALLAWLQANRQPPGRSLGIYCCRNVRGSKTRSIHSEGRALDWGLPLGPSGKGTPEGHELVDLLGSHADQLGIQCIIYDHKIWSAKSPNGRRYNGKQPHYDHLHIELTRSAAADLTLDATADILGGSNQAPKATVRKGDRGPTVKLLQQQLAAVGHDPGDIDGDFGDKTLAALRAFQQAHGLTADGVAGPQTWAALERALADKDGGGSKHWPDVPADERMRTVTRLLVEEHGYPAAGAAGIVGNLWVESGVLPSRIEGSNAKEPMRAKDFSGKVVTFTAEQIRDRDKAKKRGPRLPGVGLAQWTYRTRRAGLFAHSHKGVVHGAATLFQMAAQVDYLVTELGTSYKKVDEVVRKPDVTVEAASDEIVYSFEIPGSILDENNKRLPRDHSRVQKVFAERREHSRRALKAHGASKA